MLQSHETSEDSAEHQTDDWTPSVHLGQHRQVGGQVSPAPEAGKRESPTAGTQQGVVSVLSHLIVGFSGTASKEAFKCSAQG